jgi:hypothetical protein
MPETPGKTLIRRARLAASVGSVNAQDPSTQYFLVEWYQPALAAAPLQETATRLETAAAVTSAGGLTVHLELILAAPTDEMLFSVFSADRAEAVLRVCENAGHPPDRITTDIRTHVSSRRSDVDNPKQSLQPAEVIAVPGVEV